MKNLPTNDVNKKKKQRRPNKKWKYLENLRQIERPEISL